MKKSTTIKLLFLFLFIGGSMQITSAQDNLAFEKNVYTNDGEGTVSSVVDGEESTRWTASISDVTRPIVELTIDLESYYYINAIQYLPYSDRILQYTIEGSLNNEEWFVLSDETGNTVGGSEVTKSFNSEWVRFVKFSFQRGVSPAYDGEYVSLYEMRVFESTEDGNKADAFTIDPVVDADPSSVVTSNSITVSGLTESGFIAVISDQEVNYSINSGSYTSTIGSVSNDDVVTVQLTTDVLFETDYEATLVINGQADDFMVTTRALGANDNVPDEFVIPAISDVNLFEYITSESFTITGLDDPATISISSSSNDYSYSINGGAFTSEEGSVSNNDVVQVKIESGGLYGQSFSATIDINTITADFVVTTKDLMLNEGTNLALNKTLTATTTSEGEVGYLVDGDVNTVWKSSTWPVSFTVDLGAEYMIEEIELVSPISNRDYQFNINGSLDGNTFYLISDETDNREGAAEIIVKSFYLTKTRYVQIEVVSAATYGGPYTGFYQFRVFGESVSTSSTDDIYSPKVSLFPNPTNGDVTINFADKCFNNLKVVSIVGTELINIPIDISSTLHVPFHDYPAGIYIFILTGEGTKELVKVIKE